MFTDHSTNYFKVMKLDISLVSIPVRKIQKLMYLATRKYQSSQLSKYQRKLLSLKEEVLLLSLYKVINNIKKKFMSHLFIITNS